MSNPLGTGQSLFHPPSPSLPGAHLPLRPPPDAAEASGIAMREAAFLARNAGDPLALRASSNPPVDQEGNTAMGDRPHESADEESAEEEDEEEEEDSLPAFPTKFHSSIDYAPELPFNLTLKNDNSLTNATNYLAWLIRQSISPPRRASLQPQG